jgi:photosystem II stability/assembly factor-like uncharacterized protein
MKKTSSNCILVFLLFKFGFAQSKLTSRVKIDTLLTGAFSTRAIALNNNTLYYATNTSKLGYISLTNKSKIKSEIEVSDNLKYEFRSIAITNNHIFILSIGNPAKLFKVSKDLKTCKEVYRETNDNVFYDSMLFWDNANGIAVGDPTTNCLSIIQTHDGGENWIKSNCTAIPKSATGEAAFAASNTNISSKGEMTWIVSGGIKSRVYKSSDFGLNWTATETPILQGTQTTGIFSADFYNEKIGYIAGGDYEKPSLNSQNKAQTFDGGISWRLVSNNEGIGYTSCVQYVPKSKGNKLIAVGGNGVYYSNNKGVTWQLLIADNSLYTIRYWKKNTFIAAGKNKIISIKLF